MQERLLQWPLGADPYCAKAKALAPDTASRYTANPQRQVSLETLSDEGLIGEDIQGGL